MVVGIPRPKEAIIDAPIIRHPKRPQTFKVSNGGKSAQTKYKVLKSLVKDRQTYSLVELNPLTGRTHQLRVHLTYIDHPIVGDVVYGKGDGALMLHAASVAIALPNGQRKTFSAETPKLLMDFVSP